MDEFIHNNNENCITNNDFNAPDRKNEFMFTFKHGLRFHNQLFQSLISKCVLNRQKKGKNTLVFQYFLKRNNDEFRFTLKQKIR